VRVCVCVYLDTGKTREDGAKDAAWVGLAEVLRVCPHTTHTTHLA